MSIRSKLCMFLVGGAIGCASDGGIPFEEGEAATSQQAATVNTTAATVTGNCARLDEVEMSFPVYADFKVAGGWTTSSTAGDARRDWPAIERYGCGTFGSPNKNVVICYYRTDRGPDLKARKDFPSEYDCTCSDSTGRYTCIRQ
jgi:hypothetical protein